VAEVGAVDVEARPLRVQEDRVGVSLEGYEDPTEDRDLDLEAHQSAGLYVVAFRSDVESDSLPIHG